MTFEDAVHECFGNPDLMAEYRRLTGSTLGLDTRSGLARMIDEAAKHDPWESEWAPFFEFVRDCVWKPLVFSALAEAVTPA